MARTIPEIKNSITASFMGNPDIQLLYGFSAGQNFSAVFSKVSFESILFDIVSTAYWVMEQLFDLHKSEITTIIENTRPAYIPWLIQKIKDFQFGYDLIADSIEYDNTGLSDEIIEISKVVRHCAITELRRGLRIKVAGESAGALQPLTSEQELSLNEYIKRVRPFVPFKLTNQDPDQLILNLKIYYNPLVLDASGKRLDGSNDTPVTAAINTYLTNLPFNGRFILASMLDQLQKTDGVSIPHCVSAFAQYASTGLLPIDVYYLPDAGYMNLLTLNVEYIPDEHI